LTFFVSKKKYLDILIFLSKKHIIIVNIREYPVAFNQEDHAMKLNTMIEDKEDKKDKDKPWWNRPLVGDRTLVDYMFISTDSRQEIPERTVYLNNYATQKLEKINLTLKALFSEKFSQPDFLVFARIQSYLSKYFKQKNHYFIQSIDFFTMIFSHLDSLSNLTNIESEYQGEIFTQFYLYSEQLADQFLDKLVFQEKLKKRRQIFLKSIENPNDAKIIEIYTNNLLLISEVPHLLLTFYLLKRKLLDNWHLFRKIRDFIHHGQNNDLEELKAFILVIKADYDWLKALLVNIVGIKDKNVDVISLARVLQYIALNYKYESVYHQFERFLIYLAKWEKTYCYILSLREEYPSDHYHYPSSFKSKLPGFDLYKVYHDYLDSSYLLKKLT